MTTVSLQPNLPNLQENQSLKDTQPSSSTPLETRMIMSKRRISISLTHVSRRILKPPMTKLNCSSDITAELIPSPRSFYGKSYKRFLLPFSYRHPYPST